MSHDEVIAEYRRDPQSVFPAPSTDWFQQGIALDRASAQNPRHAVSVPPPTYRGALPPAVRSGGVVIVDVERWPANLRSAIGLPAAGAQTQPSVAPPPKAPAPRGGAQQQRRPVPSNPLSPDEVIAQYRRNPQSVLRHPSSRAFKETLVLEGFDGDEFPIAVRGGEFVIIDVERWPAHLRAAIGLEEKPK